MIYPSQVFLMPFATSYFRGFGGKPSAVVIFVHCSTQKRFGLHHVFLGDVPLCVNTSKCNEYTTSYKFRVSPGSSFVLSLFGWKAARLCKGNAEFLSLSWNTKISSSHLGDVPYPTEREWSMLGRLNTYWLGFMATGWTHGQFENFTCSWNRTFAVTGP